MGGYGKLTGITLNCKILSTKEKAMKKIINNLVSYFFFVKKTPTSQTIPEIDPILSKYPSCEERIDNALSSRLEDINPNFNFMRIDDIKKYCEEYTTDIPDGIVYHNGVAFDFGISEEDSPNEYPLDIDDEREQWIEFAEQVRQEYAGQNILSIEEFKTAKILLSTGGPEDYFEIQYNDDGIIGGRYFFRDWFDTANRYVSAEQAEDVINGLGVYLEGLY